MPVGPCVAHHLRLDPALFDVEIGFPAAAPIAPAGCVVPRIQPAARVVRTIYRGGYEGLPAAWAAFDAWRREHPLALATDVREVYAVGPASEVDPAAFQTELLRPLLA